MFKIDRKTIYWWKKRREETLRPGQTIILDNASFHKSKRTRELIEDAGCKVLFLPPYSPDLNSIEKPYKTWYKKSSAKLLARY